jgi:dimeric dUTPase (all-alpha-NTP-PPase superfamily)
VETKGHPLPLQSTRSQRLREPGLELAPHITAMRLMVSPQGPEVCGLALSSRNLSFRLASPFGLASGARRSNDLGMERPDQLRELFRMQKALNERIGVRTEGMSEEDKTKWLLNYCRAMSQEIAELTDSVPWKWWAKYQKFDEQNARVEVVDLFHFLISLAQVLGMSADDVFNAYIRKNEVNFKRQDSGYTVKDEHDSKHI